MQVERAVDGEVWNDFVSDQSGRVFSMWEWGTINEMYDHDRVYLVCRDGGEIQGCLPLVHLESRLFGSKLVSVPFAEYGGATVVPDDETVCHSLVERAVAIADERSVDYLLLRGVNEVHNSFNPEQQYVTFRLSLTDGTEPLWNGFESRLRRGIRKARKHDVETRVVSSRAGIDTFYSLFLKTMRGHGTPPHSVSIFHRLQDLFGDDDMIQVYLAFADDTPINGIVVLRDYEHAYYWTGASDYKYRDLNGGSLLLWTAIQDAVDAGCQEFDLGRTREGSGVYMYKKGFNREKTQLTDAYYCPGTYQTAPDPDDETYSLASTVWQRLPIPATKYLGPPLRKHFP